MKTMTADALRDLFRQFFQSKGHTIISSASIVPENDPTVLFTTAGMHPLVPYLLGAKHPAGTRLTDVQKCIRTGDIDDVGDSSHLTFFEMLGNWSLGDYFKKEAIAWSWEFLTSPEYLGIPKDRLAFSVFEGNEHAPRDTESYDLWRSMGVEADRLFFLPRENNWWGPAGQTGPCGPDTEMFIITDKEPCGPDCSPACSCGRYLEIWNNVFMQYNKQADGSFLPLEKPNVDTGMGLERTLCVLTGKKSVYETELFTGILARIAELCGKAYDQDEETTHAFRIVADHLRAATFMLGDSHGIVPSNVDQGYVLRRLIRRSVRFGMQLGMQEGFTAEIAKVVIAQYEHVYPELAQNAATIEEQLVLEENRFQRTLRQGVKEFDKLMVNIDNVCTQMNEIREKISALMPDAKRMQQASSLAAQIGSTIRPLPELKQGLEDLKNFGQAVDVLAGFGGKLSAFTAKLRNIDGVSAFKLYDTYGFPIEMTMELAREHGLQVDVEAFNERFHMHQETSHAGAEQRFKGGLADSSEQTARLHTATHLLHAALRRVLGPEVAQRGSNITAERLRFDFSFGRKMTKEEIEQVQTLVRQAIAANIPVDCREMTVSEAKAEGAIGLFESKYGDQVKVYTMGAVSKEICGGPHAQNTGDLGGFTIQKEESSSAGVRRIKAVIGA